jgi:hypothetical protein
LGAQGASRESACDEGGRGAGGDERLVRPRRSSGGLEEVEDEEAEEEGSEEDDAEEEDEDDEDDDVHTWPSRWS